MLLLCTALAVAGEHPLDPSALPPAVVAAVQARYPGATISAAAQEEKEYEATVTIGERHLDLAIGADGAWMEEEERAAATELPAVVSATLDALVEDRWDERAGARHPRGGDTLRPPRRKLLSPRFSAACLPECAACPSSGAPPLAGPAYAPA